MPIYANTILITGPNEDVAGVVEAHRAHLRRLHDGGRLRLAGAFTRDDGFLEIFEAGDRLEAEEIARASPLIEAGLGAWILRELELL